MQTRQYQKTSLIMMEAGQWKTTKEVTRNTCNPEHHLQEFTGSKSLIVGLFVLKD